MSRASIKVLLVEDNPTDVIFLREALTRDTPNTFELTVVERLSQAIDQLKSLPFDIVLLDLNLPDSSGLDSFSRIHQATPELPKVILSGLIDEKIALQSVQAGAQDYLVKGQEGFSAAARAIRYAIERQQTQRALRESEGMFKGFLNSAPDAIVVANAAGKIVLVNVQVERLFGYTQAELLGKSIDLLVPDRFRHKHIEHRSAFFSNPRPNSTTVGRDLSALRKDGSEFPAEISLSSYQMGDETMVIGSVRDITERKRAEEAIRQLNQAIEQSPVLVMVTDTDGVIQYVNPKFSQVTGFSAQEVIGKTPSVLKSGEHLPTFYRDLWNTIRAGREWRGEFHNRKKSGELYWEQASITGVKDQHGKITHYVAVKEDITQRKQLEQERVRQERLAAVGQLAAGIAHDFNNLLMTIIGNADLLKHRQDIPDHIKPKLTVIVQQSERAAQLTRQILDFSRQTVNEPQPLDLKVYLGETLRFIERTIPETIEVQFDFDDGNYVINADPTQLQQVITNLAVNARDAMPDGGVLTFDLSFMRQAEDQTPLCPNLSPGDWVRLTVADTGKGIAPEILPHIFEPFFTTKQVGHGTGLGLAQIYGIVMQHNGCIDVDSQPHRGTTFFLYFPAVSSSVGTKNDAAETIPTGRGETILLVEDDQIVLEVTRIMLETLNYRVLMARNGKEALKLYRAKTDQVALVLTDAVMPVMDGFALASALQTEAPELPVMLISGYVKGSLDAISELPRNITARLLKPLGVHQMAHALQDALEVCSLLNK